VAEYLRVRDYDISVPETVVRPDFDQRHHYRDGGDILMQKRIEVKRRRFNFTCAEDYPYDTVILSPCYVVDRIPLAQLEGFVVVNEPGTHICIVKADSRPEWQRIQRYDRYYARQEEYYTVSKEWCWFDRIDRTPRLT
jgi:hypothetical protein